MQTINVLPCERHNAYRSSEPRECIAIRAQRYRSHGSAAVEFFALTTDGEWLAFFKRDNPRMKLPKTAELTWGDYEIDSERCRAGRCSHCRYDSHPKTSRSAQVAI